MKFRLEPVCALFAADRLKPELHAFPPRFATTINSLSSNVLIAPDSTDDRSEARLLGTFLPTAPAGTRINPTALSLLNFKLGTGQFLIPTPQSNGAGSFSTFSTRSTWPIR